MQSEPDDYDDVHAADEANDIPKHVDFLRCYLGRPTDDFRSLKSYMTIGLRFVDRRAVEVTQPFGRHSVLSVEGDRAYAILLRTSNEVATAAAAAMAAMRDSPSPPPSPASPSSPTSPPCPRLPLLPNAIMCCLHYGNNTLAFPHTTFRVILSSTTLRDGDVVLVCPQSVRRCHDELGWYQSHSGDVRYGRYHRMAQHIDTRGAAHDPAPLLPEPKGILATRSVPLWPAGVPYYHGVGARHASTEALVSFPSTLLEVQCCPQLGPGELEVVAAHRIAYGTCFLYAGPTHASRRAKPNTKRGRGHAPEPKGWQPPTAAIPAEESYHIFLSKGVTCHGQCIARYINHRFNFSQTGNVDLAAAMIPVQRDRCEVGSDPSAAVRGGNGGASKKAGGDRRVTLDNNDSFVSIPFFVISSPVEVGCRVLARSYGNEYDARLERQAMTRMQWVPYCCAAAFRRDGQPLSGCSPTFDGTYLQSVELGSLVWRPDASMEAQHRATPWRDVYLVVQRLHASVLVLRHLAPCDAADATTRDADGDDEVVPTDYVRFDLPRGSTDAWRHGGQLWCCNVEEVALLLEDVDFVDAATVPMGPKMAGPAAAGGSAKTYRAAMHKAWAQLATHVVYNAATKEPYLFGAMWPYVADALIK